MNQFADKFLLEIISREGSAVGKSPFMPGWGSQLKEKQAREIVSYIRSLAVPSYSQPGK
jgi:mono/diheme cytochrome c family protein